MEYMNRGFDYILKKYAHCEGIEETKKFVDRINTYYYATNQPSVKTLLLILRNYRFNLFYLKQTVKIILGIFKKKILPKKFMDNIYEISCNEPSTIKCKNQLYFLLLII